MSQRFKVKPLCNYDNNVVEKIQGNYSVYEITEQSIQEILTKGLAVQGELSEINIWKRLDIIEEMGKIWQEKLDRGELDEIKELLTKSTGYSKKLIEMELSFVPLILNRENIIQNLKYSLSVNIEALERFVEVKDGESLRIMPVGPVFIISSGNSLIPPLIPSIISLVTGNFTIVKPSLSNYVGVTEVFKILFSLASINDVAKTMADALLICYFTHDSATLKYLLSKAKIGVVNFWGGEPARSTMAKIISENPNHPRFIVNGPMTGCAIIDEESSNEENARGLAMNIILYDQQLCSSPTFAIFIGSYESALSFLNLVKKFLNEIGSEMEIQTDEASIFLTQSVRRFLQLRGSSILFSNDFKNLWTLILSKKKSTLDQVVSVFPAFNLYNRKRFLEIVVVDSMEEALEHVKTLPYSAAFKGIDAVQTIGYAIGNEKKEKLFKELAKLGVYRIVPLSDMYMRSAIEPYDGMSLPLSFTKILYCRNR